MGDVFCNIGVREPQKTASEAFCQFGEYHRMMEKYGIKMLKATKPVRLDSLNGIQLCLQQVCLTFFIADTA